MTEMDTPTQSQKNVPAIVGLVVGLFACLPGVGLIALIFGVLGLARGRDPRIGGRHTAMLGVILGVLGIFWTAMVLGAYMQSRAWQKADPAIRATRQFIMLVGSGQVGSAKALCSAEIDEAQLTETAEKFQEWGGLTGDVDTNEYGKIHDDDEIEIHARMPFASSAKIMATRWRMVEGAPMLVKYEVFDAPSTTAPPSTTRPAP